jgi:triosephosphate isomerase
VNLASAASHLEFTNIAVAAQNMHQAEGGAFTGEISADMLKKCRCSNCNPWSFRTQSHETDAIIADKVNTALAHDMTVLLFW